jgi:hypothetical protein
MCGLSPAWQNLVEKQMKRIEGVSECPMNCLCSQNIEITYKVRTWEGVGPAAGHGRGWGPAGHGRRGGARHYTSYMLHFQD